MSHSQGLALLAVTREREVGIDLEYQRPEVRTGDICDINHFLYSSAGCVPQGVEVQTEVGKAGVLQSPCPCCSHVVGDAEDLLIRRLFSGPKRTKGFGRGIVDDI